MPLPSRPTRACDEHPPAAVHRLQPTKTDETFTPQLTAELGGGKEMEDLEAQRIETTKRYIRFTAPHTRIWYKQCFIGFREGLIWSSDLR